ncbi:MAG: DUF885 domain-containing protein [Planctomycetota bacterium]
MSNVEQAEAYVQRLEGLPGFLVQVGERVDQRMEKGVMPPRFVLDQVIQDCRNVIAGTPIDATGGANVMWADLGSKLDGLQGLDPATRTALERRAERALVQGIAPAYRQLITRLEGCKQQTDDRAGIWKLPQGEEYYAFLLRKFTDTDWDADTVHALGLAQVRRIHGEMEAIRQQVGFEGDLQAFFAWLRTAPEQFYPNDDAGKAAYLAEATRLIDTMRSRLPEVFGVLPKADIEVCAVEAWREKSAGKAFYNSGTPDGSRPGRYYANLYDMANMPKYQMEALAYHEGIPGHHMQISIAQELEDLPRFRRFGGYTAYVEGWGLYSEWLPKQMGFYADPYSDFGRLAMELWRACRLVVDTGLHHKHWTREQAIDYLVQNTPNPEDDCRKAIERYIVMPGQATAYMVGMLKLRELRALAENQLGERFDVRGFHDVVLRAGALPLDVLEEEVRAWIAERGGAGA